MDYEELILMQAEQYDGDGCGEDDCLSCEYLNDCRDGKRTSCAWYY